MSTTRHPAGARGQLAAAGCPVGQVISTTVASAGGPWDQAWKNCSGAHQTSYACGIQVTQDSPVPMARCCPGRSPVPLTMAVTLRSWAGVSACEMWLVICSEATRLTAPSPAQSTPARQRPPNREIATTQASSTNTTAVASSTLACVQFWVSTAGSANTNAAPNPDVGTDEPAYTLTTIAASSVGGTTDYPTIEVPTFYPGASPDVTASSITAPLERQFGQVPGLNQMTSNSSFGSSVITLQFVLNLNIDVAEQEVQAAINAASTYLPANLPSPPIYSKTNPADAPILTLGLTSTRIPLAQVEDLADTRLAQRISQLSGVGLVSIGGGQKPAVRIAANPTVLASYGLTLEDVRSAVGLANVNEAKGNFDGSRQGYTIDANDQLLTAKEYAPLIVAYRNGAPIVLSDVAKVTDSAENVKQLAWMNTTPAVILNIQRQPGANIIAVVDRIKALLPRLQAALPDSVHVSVLTDRTTTIRASVADVQFELMLTVALVVMVIFLFLRSLASPCRTMPAASSPRGCLPPSSRRRSRIGSSTSSSPRAPPRRSATGFASTSMRVRLACSFRSCPTDRTSGVDNCARSRAELIAGDVRGLILSGGVAHAFADTSAAIAARLAALDVRSSIATDLEAALARSPDVELLVFDLFRDQYFFAGTRSTSRSEYTPSPPVRQAIVDHLARGGGLLALHGAVISFADWPQWRSILGCRLEAGNLGTPETGGDGGEGPPRRTPDRRGVRRRFASPTTSRTAFSTSSRTTSGSRWSAHGGVEHPMLWVRSYGGGRVAYLAPAHGLKTHSHPVYQLLLEDSALVAARSGAGRLGAGLRTVGGYRR